MNHLRLISRSAHNSPLNSRESSPKSDKSPGLSRNSSTTSANQLFSRKHSLFQLGKSTLFSLSKSQPALSNRPSRTKASNEELNKLIKMYGEDRAKEIEEIVDRYGIESAKDVLEMHLLLENASITTETAPKRNSWMPVLLQVERKRPEKKESMDSQKLIVLVFLGGMLLLAVVGRVVVFHSLCWAVGAVFSLLAAGFTVVLLARQATGGGPGLLHVQIFGFVVIEVIETFIETFSSSEDGHCSDTKMGMMMYGLLFALDCIMFFIAAILLIWFAWFNEDEDNITESESLSSVFPEYENAASKTKKSDKQKHANAIARGMRKMRMKSPTKKKEDKEKTITLEEVRKRNSGSLLELRNRDAGDKSS